MIRSRRLPNLFKGYWNNYTRDDGGWDQGDNWGVDEKSLDSGYISLPSFFFYENTIIYLADPLFGGPLCSQSYF